MSIEKVKCRGRNGWFTLSRIEIFSLNHTWIEAYSKNIGRTAPIIFQASGRNGRINLGKLFIKIGEALLNEESNINKGRGITIHV